MRWVHLGVLLTVVVWGWSFVATKVLLRYLGPAEVLGARLLLGVPFLLALALAQKARLGFRGRELRTVVISSLVLLLHLAIQVIALGLTTATTTAGSSASRHCPSPRYPSSSCGSGWGCGS